MTVDQQRRSADLMRLSLSGDQTAYASLLTLLASIAGQFARARLGAVPWIDDVVQETLLAVHKGRHTYDPARPFAPWFYAIASNRLIDVLRRERRVTSREVAVDVLPDMPLAAGAAADDVDAEGIRAAVASLPARQRQVIAALKFDNQSVRHTAARLGMTESNVKVTAHRGYRALRRLLGGPQS